MKTFLAPEIREADYQRLLGQIDALLWELVYLPLVDLVRPALPAPVRKTLAPRDLKAATPRELRNAGEAEGAAALKKALQTGAAQMLPDPTGKSALFAVAKPDRRVSDGLKAFGCRLNKTTGLWACAPAQVPAWVRAEASGYALKMRAVHDSVDKLLGDLEAKVDAAVDNFNLTKGADHAIGEVAKSWKESAKSLEVVPDLGAAGLQALGAGFAANAKIPIKGWAKETIARLRAEVDANARQGFRAEGLAERIRNEYGVSKGRAGLIARQETGNFMAAYTEARAADAGLRRYIWRATRDARTREDHKKLDGTVQRFDRPPVTDSASGARNNPGRDFRCRCRAAIVIE